MRPNRLLDDRRVGGRDRVWVEGREQVRAPVRRPRKCLVTPPPGDLGMVARGQDRRHIEAAPAWWFRVGRALEQSSDVRLIDQRFGIADGLRRLAEDFPFRHRVQAGPATPNPKGATV